MPGPRPAARQSGQRPTGVRRRTSLDDRFEAGLRLVLDGIEPELARSRS